MTPPLTASLRIVAAACAGFLGLLGSAHAFQDDTRSVYIEAGHAPHGGSGTNSLELGLTLPWVPPWQSSNNGPLTTYWDLYVSDWDATRPNGDGRRSYAQVGAIATWRYRFGEGSSPWFAEAGIGGTVLNHLYHTHQRDFSTAFQFTEVLGVGRSFGMNGQHEVSLRFQHFSNADISKPNPGENFFRVRYAYHF